MVPKLCPVLTEATVSWHRSIKPLWSSSAWKPDALPVCSGRDGSLPLLACWLDCQLLPAKERALQVDGHLEVSHESGQTGWERL